MHAVKTLTSHGRTRAAFMNITIYQPDLNEPQPVRHYAATKEASQEAAMRQPR